MLCDLVGEALPVDLLVVEDVRLRAALLLLVGDLRRGLDVVGGDDAPEGALAGRVVLVGLALVGALGAGQADVVFDGRDLQDAGLVDDRDRDRRGARVELAEVGDRRLVLRGLARVRRDLARLPLAGRGRGVVERDVLDRELADLAAGLLQGELLAVDDGLRLRPRVALQRQARVDGQRVGAGAAGTAAARRRRCRTRRRRTTSAATRQLEAASERTRKVVPPQRRDSGRESYHSPAGRQRRRGPRVKPP